MSARLEALSERLKALQSGTTRVTTQPPATQPLTAPSPQESVVRPLVERLRLIDERLHAPAAARASLAEASSLLAVERACGSHQVTRSAHIGRALIDERTSAGLAEERRARVESEARLLRTIDEKAIAAHTTLARERRDRHDAEQAAAAELNELADTIAQEREQRSRMLSDMEARYGDAVKELQESLKREREERERGTAELVQMLDEVRRAGSNHAPLHSLRTCRP